MNTPTGFPKDGWRGKSYAFFRHTACEYFPCHPEADPENFNCLFCYCPLYALGDACGGRFSYAKNGVKDCRGCLVPHDREEYGRIVEKARALIEATKRDTQGSQSK